VHTYQRQVSCLKPPCCDDGCGPRRGCKRSGCGNGCGNRCGSCNNCRNGNGACCNGGANGACLDGACGNGGACGTGACDNACGANGACGNGLNGNAACCPNGGNGACGSNCDPGCAAPSDPGCAAPGGDCCDNSANYEACRIAKLIYESQTACYAKTRRNAIRQLAKYDCVCHPEIMSAFVYALNDADERVRAAAADAIGDQVRRNSSCCSSCVIAALTRATADCDKTVRKYAEKALCACGYDLIDQNCDVATEPCCNNGGDACCNNGNACVNAYVPAATTAPVEGEVAPAPPEGEAAPAPAPPAEPAAFYPTPSKVQARPASHRRSLKNLFGLIN
jgi:hypothetical protein